jgi:hypothetical protein
MAPSDTAVGATPNPGEAIDQDADQRPVPKSHPRLGAETLKQLARFLRREDGCLAPLDHMFGAPNHGGRAIA